MYLKYIYIYSKIVFYKSGLIWPFMLCFAGSYILEKTQNFGSVGLNATCDIAIAMPSRDAAEI